MDINQIVKVTSRAWSLNILALMHSGIPSRQATLLSASGAGRTAFTQSMHHLIDMELLEKNPGHGHPLRPEYRLTPQGLQVAIIASKINTSIPQATERALLRRAWTIPVLIASQEPRFFTGIKRELAPITDRALSQSLKLLQRQHWIKRIVDTEVHPLRPQYQATNNGALICQAISL